MPSVAIVGCGWFGLPLAKSLVKDGYVVNGSKRDKSDAEALMQHGINGFPLDLSLVQPELANAHSALFNTDYLVINIPPALRLGTSSYLARIDQLLALISGKQFKRVIFISTTGVYEADGKVDEHGTLATTESAQTLLSAETRILHFCSQGVANNGCIVRCAGLIGPKRHPGRFLAGKTDLSGGQNAVNLVHLDDCIAAVKALMTAEKVSQIYNLCIPEHPTKAAFYCYASVQLGLAPPQFTAPDVNDVDVPVNALADKIVDGNRICREVNFSYRYQTISDALVAC